jgi:hypothetical protein
MSTQIYTYEAHFKWKWDKHFDAWATQDEATVKANLTADFKTAFMARFAAEMAVAGHWFKFDDCQTQFTAYWSDWSVPLPLPMLHVHAEGETTIFFETDVKDALAHGSPQLWQLVKDCIGSIIYYLTQHPEIAVLLLAVGVLTILAVWLINTVTRAIQGLGGDTGSLVITLGILAVVGIAVYALFFTRTGEKASSKGYQISRRAYHRVREGLR